MEGASKQVRRIMRTNERKKKQKKLHNEVIHNFYSSFNIARLFNKVQLEERHTYYECLVKREMNEF
jgi:hypothetical protein